MHVDPAYILGGENLRPEILRISQNDGYDFLLLFVYFGALASDAVAYPAVLKKREFVLGP